MSPSQDFDPRLKVTLDKACPRPKNCPPNFGIGALEKTSPARERLSWIPALRIAAVIAAMAFVMGSGVVPCGFAQTTHLPCPGCGSTRSVQALLHGDVLGAIRMNPFGPVMAVMLALLSIDAFVVVLRDGDTRRVGTTRSGRFLTRALVAIAVLEVLLWITRFFGAFGGPVPV